MTAEKVSAMPGNIDGAVKEIFDVAVITGHACPMSIGPSAPEIIKFVTHAA